MVYDKFGRIFKKIREQKRIPLSKFSSLGISKSSLSRFERGESMMSFENIYFALQIMGISLEEFENVLNDYSPSEFDYFLEQIEEATTNLDNGRLLELQKSARESGYYYISLSAKSALQPLSESERETLTDYFYELYFWTYKELCILYLVLENLNTHDILHILDNFLIGDHKILNSRRYRSYLVQACCKAIIILSIRGYQDYSKHILSLMDNKKLVNSMFLRNVRNMTYGYWVYSFEDQVLGKSFMKNALDIFSSVSTPEIANYYQKQYERYIEKR